MFFTKKGHSLTPVIISVTIVVFVIISLYGLMKFSYKMNELRNKEFYVLNIIESEMNKVLSTNELPENKEYKIIFDGTEYSIKVLTNILNSNTGQIEFSITYKFDNKNYSKKIVIERPK